MFVAWAMRKRFLALTRLSFSFASGYILSMLAIFVASFPFTLGYSLLLLFHGITFGFLYGFMAAYAGSLAGGICSFLFCKRFFRRQIISYLEKTTPLAVAKSILQEQPLKVGCITTLLSFILMILICLLRPS